MYSSYYSVFPLLVFFLLPPLPPPYPTPHPPLSYASSICPFHPPLFFSASPLLLFLLLLFLLFSYSSWSYISPPSSFPPLLAPSLFLTCRSSFHSVFQQIENLVEAELCLEELKKSGLPVAITLCVGPQGDHEGNTLEECAVRLAQAGKTHTEGMIHFCRPEY